jgi:hypothetical protein
VGVEVGVDVGVVLAVVVGSVTGAVVVDMEVGLDGPVGVAPEPPAAGTPELAPGTVEPGCVAASSPPPGCGPGNAELLPEAEEVCEAVAPSAGLGVDLPPQPGRARARSSTRKTLNVTSVLQQEVPRRRL